MNGLRHLFGAAPCREGDWCVASSRSFCRRGCACAQSPTKASDEDLEAFHDHDMVRFMKDIRPETLGLRLGEAERCECRDESAKAQCLEQGHMRAFLGGHCRRNCLMVAPIVSLPASIGAAQSAWGRRTAPCLRASLGSTSARLEHRSVRPAAPSLSTPPHNPHPTVTQIIDSWCFCRLSADVVLSTSTAHRN